MKPSAAVVSQAVRIVGQDRVGAVSSTDKLYVMQTLKDLQECAEDLERVINAIEMAVIIKGPAPKLHEEVVARHRKEWPMLWNAIDAARAVLAKHRG